MKYLLVVLSTVFLIYSCSGQDSQITSDVTSDSTAEESITDEAPTQNETEENAEQENTEDDRESINKENEGAQDKEDEDDTAGLDQKNVKLVIKNQTTAGQIVVEQIATSRDGWVSIHKSEEGGSIQLPDSIGEARVDSGDSEDVIVDLWEAPDIGEKLWVLLHIDAGERGKYEYPGEDQAVRKNGETMARSFVIEDPNPDKENDEEDE